MHMYSSDKGCLGSSERRSFRNWALKKGGSSERRPIELSKKLSNQLLLNMFIFSVSVTYPLMTHALARLARKDKQNNLMWLGLVKSVG